jgi:outer membrane lipoprotein-sorting protein
MTKVLIRLAVLLLFSASAATVSAQTADEVIEKSVTALGGRAAHAKVKSRVTAGTIVLTTPGGDIEGAIELTNAAPNKSRMLLKADLSALGAGPLVIDQRFDGSAGYVLDSLQGNREITGNQLDNLKNGSFPHPFLTFKDIGTKAELKGKEKVGDREAFLLIFDPTTGSEQRQYIDAETYLPIRMVMTVNVPQLGQDVEQITEFLDYKEVDGIKIPFRLKSSSAIQNFTITVSKVEQNVKVDDTLFVKPAQ